jgi:hypothetical protein
LTRPNLKRILEEQKISDLEELIPKLEKNLKGVPQAMIAEIAHLKSRINEYKLEYKERVGKDYEVRR